MKKTRKQVFNKLNKPLARHNKHVKLSGVNENSNDRLELLKAKYDQEVQAKEQELAVLKAKLRNLVEFAEESQDLNVPKEATDRYASWGTTEAVFDAVNSLWHRGKGTSHYGITAGQVRDYMILRGFTPKADPHNFSITVNVTLKRLTDSGRIRSGEFSGKKFYKPNVRFSGTGGEVASLPKDGKSPLHKRETPRPDPKKNN